MYPTSVACSSNINPTVSNLSYLGLKHELCIFCRIYLWEINRCKNTQQENRWGTFFSHLCTVGWNFFSLTYKFHRFCQFLDFKSIFVGFASNPIALPDIYFHWSLLLVASFVTRPRGICVVSSIVLFSNHRPLQGLLFFQPLPDLWIFFFFFLLVILWINNLITAWDF